MLYFPFLYFLLSFSALVFASYSDLRERIVSNRLVFFLFFFGLVLKSFESFFAASFEPLITSFLGFFVAFSVSFLLYKLGVWAAGDVKLVSALAFVNPVNYAFLRDAFVFYLDFDFFSSHYFYSVSLPVFGLSLVVYSALSVFPLGLFMVLLEALKRPSLLRACLVDSFKHFFYLFQLSFFVSSSVALLGFFSKGLLNDYFFHVVFYLVFFVVFFFSNSFVRLVLFFFSSAFALFFLGFGFILPAFYSLLVLFFVYFLFKAYFSFKDFAFAEEVSLARVSEGMIPVDYVKVEKDSVFFFPKPSIKSVINDLSSHNFKAALDKLKPTGFFASPYNACGFSEEEAEVLRRIALKKGSPEVIKVKKTMPFVPAIAFAFVFLSLTGDFLWNVVF